MALLASGVQADEAQICKERANQLFDGLLGQGFNDDCLLDQTDSLCNAVDGHASDCLDEDHCQTIIDASDTECASGTYCCTAMAVKETIFGSSETLVESNGACAQECVDKFEPAPSPPPLSTGSPPTTESGNDSDTTSPPSTPSPPTATSPPSAESMSGAPSPPTATSPPSAENTSGEVRAAGNVGGVLAFAVAAASALL